MRAHVAACMAVTFLILYACFAVNASAPVRFLKLYPRMSAAPLREVRATIWVEQDEQNRSLELRIAGDDFDRASAVPLEGDRASRVAEFRWVTFIPCGEYRWTATTFNQSGAILARATDRSFVCGMAGP